MFSSHKKKLADTANVRTENLRVQSWTWMATFNFAPQGGIDVFFHRSSDLYRPFQTRPAGLRDQGRLMRQGRLRSASVAFRLCWRVRSAKGALASGAESRSQGRLTIPAPLFGAAPDMAAFEDGPRHARDGRVIAHQREP